MPWTFSHPAAVLTLRRFCPRYLSFPALLVGSTMPDFGYYVPGSKFATEAHSFSGLIHTCLPSGLLVLWVLCLMRKPLCFLLPQPHRHAMQDVVNRPIDWGVALLVKVAISLVIGAGTHLIWDAFTHERDLIGLSLAALQSTLFQIGATKVPLYYLLQWLSTLIGAACLARAYRAWLRGVARPLARGAVGGVCWRRRLLMFVVALSLVIAVPLAVMMALRYEGAFAIAILLRYLAVFGVMALAILACGCAVYCYAKRDRSMDRRAE